MIENMYLIVEGHLDAWRYHFFTTRISHIVTLESLYDFGRLLANYFNPALIVDLKTRVFEGIREIEEKIK